MKLSVIENRTFYLPLDPSLLRQLRNRVTMSTTVPSQLDVFYIKLKTIDCTSGFKVPLLPFKQLAWYLLYQYLSTIHFITPK